MSKKIVRVMVMYDDGTFEECIAGAMVNTLTYPPGVRSTEPKPATTPEPIEPVRRAPWTPVDSPNIPAPWIIPPCSRCGSTVKQNCSRPDCPTGWGTPWDNSNKVID